MKTRMILLCVACLVSLGCTTPGASRDYSSMSRSGPPAGAAPWAAYRLFRTPHAYVYASSAGAADQAGHAVDRAAAIFKSKTGFEPTPSIVLIVRTEGDQVAALPWRTWAEDLGPEIALPIESSPGPGDGDESRTNLQNALAALDVSLKELGCGLDAFWAELPLPLCGRHLERISFPPTDGITVRATMFFPTDQATRRTVSKVLGMLVLDKMPSWQRVLFSIRLKRDSEQLVQLILSFRDRELISSWAQDLPGSWSEADREELIAACVPLVLPA